MTSLGFFTGKIDLSLELGAFGFEISMWLRLIVHSCHTQTSTFGRPNCTCVRSAIIFERLHIFIYSICHGNCAIDCLP